MTRGPSRIQIRGVDEVASGGEECIEQLKRRRLIRGSAEDVAAHRQRRDGEARLSQCVFDHGILLFCRITWPQA
jgi:hypothetical protein